MRNFWTRFLASVAGMAPVPALLLFMAPLLTAFAAILLEAISASPWASGYASFALFVLMLLYTGWPLAVSLHLARTFGQMARVNIPLVTVSFIYFWVTLFAPGFFQIVRSESGHWLLLAAVAMMVAGALAVIGPMYVFWSAARALCSIEEGRPATADCCLRAWFQFLFLPFRILAVQRRLHRVLAGTRP